MRASARKTRLFLHFVGFSIFLFLVASVQAEPPKAESINKDPAGVSDKAVQSPLIASASTQRMSLYKQALGRELLLRVSTIFPGPIPSFSNAATRVVMLKKIGKKLMLFAAPDQYVLNNKDVPLDFILAEFKILSDDGRTISFDFNAGMASHFLYASSWWASDMYSPSWRDFFMAVNVRHSYLAEAQVLKTGRVFIRQVAQLEYNSMQVRLPVEVRYFLEPYNDNPNFKPTRGGRFNKTGYFEVAPIHKAHGGVEILATKFDISKPVVFALSSNTPAEYREAVREGVLYWNQAFGREVLSVVDAPEQVTPPHPDYNIIQWVNWDTYGLAYADAQHNPRTGEILNSQVWLSSAWASLSKRRVRASAAAPKGGCKFPRDASSVNPLFLSARDLASCDSLAAAPKDGDLTDLMHGFFDRPIAMPRAQGDVGGVEPSLGDSPMATPHAKEGAVNDAARENLHLRGGCFYSMKPLWRDLMLQMSRLSTDEAVLQASQDVVRYLTAHEVGHVLGLRHNFAGSLAINYSPAQRRWYLDEYLKSFKVPEDAVPSSSVMDYLNTVEMFISGRQMHNQKPALAYDKYAIEKLYQLDEVKDSPADKSSGATSRAKEGDDSTDDSTRGSLQPPLGPSAEEGDEPTDDAAREKIALSLATPAFCTDTHVWRYVDCTLRDVYTGPQEAKDAFSRTLDNLPRWILERFASSTDPAPWQPVLKFEEVALWPAIYAGSLLRGQVSFLKLLTKGGRLLSVERSFDVVDDLNKERIEHITDELVTQQVQVNGGLGQVLALFKDDFVATQVQALEKLLHKSYKKAVGPGGNAYEWTDQEVEFILDKAEQFYQILQKKTEKLYLQNFVNLKDLKETPVALDLAQFLRDMARHYLMSLKSGEFVQGSLKKEDVLIPIDAPVFTYDFETRKLAARLLHGGQTDSLFWGNAERVYLRKEYKDFVTDVFKGEVFEAIEAENISPDLLTWYWEQKKLLTLL